MTCSCRAAALLAGLILLPAAPAQAASRARTEAYDADQMLGYLGLGVTLAAAVCLAGYLLVRLYRRWRRHSHEWLFYELCRVHGLDRRSRRLLRQLSRCHNLLQPARLFTEPVWLAAGNRYGPLQGRAAELAALGQRLFAEEAAPRPAPAKGDS